MPPIRRSWPSGLKATAPHLLRVGQRPPEKAAAAARVPETNFAPGLVPAPGREDFAVPAPGHGTDVAPARHGFADRLARGRVPAPGRAVVAPGQQGLAVGAEGDGGRHVRMRHDDPQRAEFAPPRGQVGPDPLFEIRRPRPGRQVQTIRQPEHPVLEMRLCRTYSGPCPLPGRPTGARTCSGRPVFPLVSSRSRRRRPSRRRPVATAGTPTREIGPRTPAGRPRPGRRRPPGPGCAAATARPAPPATPAAPDGPVLHVAEQVLGQGGGRRVAVARLLGHRLEDDRLQVAGDMRVDLAQAQGILVRHALDRGAARSASSNAGRSVSIS